MAIYDLEVQMLAFNRGNSRHFEETSLTQQQNVNRDHLYNLRNTDVVLHDQSILFYIFNKENE